ncbi:hypothetical protein COB18_03640 [Candidatus Kaiserbacteria bacterium]|nr:MAG: hypothetical protein COB18_03640 [Candidatus Kaiserbacteria bacterium]
MLPGQTEDFNAAVISVEQSGSIVDRKLAGKVIDIMYQLAGGKKMGNQFRTFRDNAMNEVGIDNLFEWDMCKLVVGRYFNPRAVAAKRKRHKPFKMKITEASADKVEVQVYPELFLVFKARRAQGFLQWGDVTVSGRIVLSGSYFVNDRHFHKAKNLAREAMNGRRRRK